MTYPGISGEDESFFEILGNFIWIFQKTSLTLSLSFCYSFSFEKVLFNGRSFMLKG